MKDDFNREDLEKALYAINSMGLKAERAKQKFVMGTAQHTLQNNRHNALNIASSLIPKESTEKVLPAFSREELEKALAPISSLLTKSEKALTKLKPGSWQNAAMSRNIEALLIVSSLLTKALDEMSTAK